MAKNSTIQKTGQKIRVRVLTEEKLTCGECIGLTRERLINGENVTCSKQGKKASHVSCSSFTPNSVALAESVEKNGSSLFELADVIRGFSLEQLRTFAAVLLNENITRKHNYTFLQKVYVRYRGTLSRTYLSNFMTARILSVDSNLIRVCSDDGKIVMSFQNMGNEKNVFTLPQFEVLRRKLEFKGLYLDPSPEKFDKKVKPLESDFDLKLNTNGVMGFIDDIGSVAKRNRDQLKRAEDAGTKIYSLSDIARDIDKGIAKAAYEDEEGHVSLDEGVDYGKEITCAEDLVDMGLRQLQRFARKYKIRIPKDLIKNEDLDEIREILATSYLAHLEKVLDARMEEQEETTKAKAKKTKKSSRVELGSLIK
jgi:hypothetical protein